jgi:hypothetical protein
MKEIQKVYNYFQYNEFVYECKAMPALIARMSEQEKQIFPFDVREIDWVQQIFCVCFGIRRFYLNEDCFSPDSGWRQLLDKNQAGMFNGLRTAIRPNPGLQGKALR